MNSDGGSTGPEGVKPETPCPQLLDNNFPSSPTKGTKRSFSGDGDGPVSSRQRLYSRKVPIWKEGDPPRTISNLYRGILEFWLLVICEQSWPFSFTPAPPKTVNSENNSRRNSIAPEKPPVLGTIDSPVELEPSDAKDEQNIWDEARFQLVVKRDQLCMFKVGISDRALDSLLESESDINRELGKIVLGVLLRLAISMSTAIGMIDSRRSWLLWH